ncbi:conserved Plasmodium protein, unknown function [Plasmodium knowlesi strain H]|uniref:LITAF domain-containing protein n=3 Tax=Plasmodium knowlesi TaxID=5850 RepID=A0A5K1UW87_PLAKH|nr:LITAF-like zinc finger protein, putative [Plasmodium knowlesi strain H]OTN68507.1 Uncharacterized protein PKNOH_S02302500 [Plasmodium knowlesi]CAA9986526.1 LITAF-like zinc finger protein, putative [Plasmodium knowlesi strain H]SBO24210.1 conserved Plasmodium protein, unknown function [Plasmodium knowlesi strain H]SBO29773.1 conserved Plasmodium protein, unknown function [Plasmodium knowlesi strain H]VVS76000.1 LITAF-like zinc finger protein, putative [Plasmodium knowlesi strain H]|eukprot:XP_002261077.1 hypothetical protein, conserved in Plasmodium species [Plasmodium knowlesi strain H]
MINFSGNGRTGLSEMNVLQNEMQEINVKESGPNNDYDDNTYNDASTCHDSNMVSNENGCFKGEFTPIRNEQINSFSEATGITEEETEEKPSGYDDEQVKEVLNCAYCNKHVHAVVKTYTPTFVYILIIILFLLLSFFTIFLLPLLYLTFKQKKYTCPYCEKNLKKSSEKLIQVKRENQILTFQFPKCAIIISAKYLALFLSLIFLIFFFYIIRISSNFNLDNLSKGPYITASWVDYLEDCGHKSQLRNKFNSIHNFKNKYDGYTIIWTGHFYQIKEGFFNSNSLFIRMNPSEYRYDKPDIRALFTDSLISQVENLQKNDLIQFECTLIQISKNRNPHLCILWNVTLMEKYEPTNFNVVDFVKHMSIMDMINSSSNANPFFMNLTSNNGEVKRSIKIVHLAPGELDAGLNGGLNGGLSDSFPSDHLGDDLSEVDLFNTSNMLHTNDEYVFNLREHQMNHLTPGLESGSNFSFTHDVSSGGKFSLRDFVDRMGSRKSGVDFPDDDESDEEVEEEVEEEDYEDEADGDNDYNIDDMQALNNAYGNHAGGNSSPFNDVQFRADGKEKGASTSSFHKFKYGDDGEGFSNEERATEYEQEVHEEGASKGGTTNGEVPNDKEGNDGLTNSEARKNETTNKGDDEKITEKDPNVYTSRDHPPRE